MLSSTGCSSGLNRPVLLSAPFFCSVVAAWVGDSRAVVGHACPSAPGGYAATPLTQDHKPEVLSETARILEAGGRVARPRTDPQGNPVGEEGGEEGRSAPVAVLLCDLRLGLCVTLAKPFLL